MTGDGTGTGTGVSINTEIDSNTGTVTVRSVDDNILFGTSGSIDSNSGLITIDADTAATANITMANGSMIDAGTGAIDIAADATATLATLTSTIGDITVTADDVALNGTLSSSGALTLEPIDAATTIGIGAGAGNFSVNDTELGNLANGFSSITIGDAAAGTGAVAVDAAGFTFLDDVTIVGGSITVGSASGTSLAAGSNAITLIARTGAISDGGDGGTDIVGDALTLQTLDATSGAIGLAFDEISLAATSLATDSSASNRADRMARPTVGLQSLVVAGSRARARADVGGVAKIRSQQTAVFQNLGANHQLASRGVKWVVGGFRGGLKVVPVGYF